jgi:hypothetical protein
MAFSNPLASGPNPHQSQYIGYRAAGPGETGYENGAGGIVPQAYVDTGDEYGMFRGLVQDGSDNANAYEFLGEQGKAQREAEQMRRFAAGVQARRAVQADLHNDLAARTAQRQVATRLEGAVAGQGPSLAGYQTQQGLAQAAGAQAAAAAGASPAMMAAAQRRAIMMSSPAAAQAAGTGAGTSASEIANYRNQLGGIAGQMRGADYAAQKGQADLEARQRAANQRMSDLYENQALDINEMQQHGQQSRLQAIQDVHGIGVQRGLQEQQRQFEQQQREQNMAQGAVSGFGALGGMLRSDERVKTDIEDGDKPVTEALARLSAKRFAYKDEGKPRVGIMAQDLERSDAGKAIVSEGGDGVKRIDVPQGLGLALAGLASVHRRLARLER